MPTDTLPGSTQVLPASSDDSSISNRDTLEPIEAELTAPKEIHVAIVSSARRSAMASVKSLLSKKEEDPIARLLFVRHRSKQELMSGPELFPRDFWSIAGTGVWDQDCFTGYALAEDFLEVMRADHPFLLGWVVQDMVRKGRFSGVEYGFLARIGECIAHRQV